jgi:hypothetical protein
MFFFYSLNRCINAPKGCGAEDQLLGDSCRICGAVTCHRFKTVFRAITGAEACILKKMGIFL